MRSKVLNTLSWQSLDLAVRRAKLEMRAHPEFDQSAFQDEAIWDSRRGNTAGWVGTYTAGFFAVEQLITKHGFAASVEYFKTGQFESSFGESYLSFEKEFQNSIIGQGTPRAGFSFDKPEWKVGFRWRYQVARSGKTTDSIQEIVGIDGTPQAPAYVLKEGDEETLYSVERLQLLETRANGIIRTRRQKANELFTWPLQEKKQWRNTFSLENVELNQTGSVDRLMKVSGMEEVKVPAGTFRAIKIEAYDHTSGRLVSEYWFSPEVKWYVRTLSYESQDTYFKEQQLTSFETK